MTAPVVVLRYLFLDSDHFCLTVNASASASYAPPPPSRPTPELAEALAQATSRSDMLAALVAPAGYLPGMAATSPVHSALRASPMSPALVMRTGDGPERPRKHRTVRGVATTLALIAANLVAPQLGGAEGRLASLLGARSAIAAPVISSGARKRAKLALKAKLSKVPVFMVTNGGGSPFLNKLSSGDQSAVMFLFPSDAQKMLKAVLKAPNGASSGAKVLPSNLDRALKLAMLPPSNSGLRDPASSRDL